MAQNPASGEYRWIQLNKEVAVNNWKYKDVKDSYSHSSDPKQWGFQTEIAFEPKLPVDHHVPRFYGTGWIYFHEKVTLDVFINFSDESNHAGLRVCYNPKSIQSTDAFLQKNESQWSHSSYRRAIYRSYVWIFDISLIKMIFRCQNDPTRTITKNFHLDSSSGTCKSEDHASSCKDEFAHFKNSEFISKLDLESLIGRKLEFGKTSFLPVDFEIRFRLRLCPLIQDKEMMDADSSCKLKSSQKMQSIHSDKLSVSAMLPCFPKNEAKPSSFHMDFDVAFEIKAGSEPSTVLQAHSWILVARSPVFSKMLTADMLEKQLGIIKMEKESTPESLTLFLTYLYSSMGLSYSKNCNYRCVDEWTPELSFQTLQLAHKYQVKDLTDFCIENIISRPDSEFTTELAVKLFKAGMLYGVDDLRQRSIEWIKRGTSELVKAELKELLKEESPDVATQIYLSLI